MEVIRTSAGALLHFGCGAERIAAQGVAECVLSFI